MGFKQKGFPMIKGSSPHKSALKDTGEERGDFTRHVSDDPHSHEETVYSKYLKRKKAKEENKKENKDLKNKLKENIKNLKDQVIKTKKTISETKKNIKSKVSNVSQNIKKSAVPNKSALKKGKIGKWWSGLEKGEKALLLGGGIVGAGIIAGKEAKKNKEEIREMALGMSGFKDPSALGYKSSDKKKTRKTKEQKAHEKYHGEGNKKGKGETIENKLNTAKRPGGTTTLSKVKYNSLIKRLTNIYKKLHPGEPVNLGFGPWKSYKKK